MQHVSETFKLDPEDSASAGTSATSRQSLGARLVEMVLFVPDDESSVVQLHRLFLIGLGVILVFVAISLFSSSWYEKVAPGPLPLRVFNIAFTVAAIAASRLISLRRWRLWAMAFCLTLVVSFTISALIVDDEESLFLALAVMVLVSAIFLPWGGRWQGWFAAANLVAFTVAALTGIIGPEDVPRWITLAGAIIFSATFAFLKDFSHRQKLLIAELRRREASFRAECEHRARAEERLQLEVGERETAQKLAQKREAILRKVLETSLDMIIISRLPELTFIYANEQFNRNGYTFEEAKGKTPADFKLFAAGREHGFDRVTEGTRDRFRSRHPNQRRKNRSVPGFRGGSRHRW
jgi:PAS domain-containing protein